MASITENGIPTHQVQHLLEEKRARAARDRWPRHDDLTISALDSQFDDEEIVSSDTAYARLLREMDEFSATFTR